MRFDPDWWKDDDTVHAVAYYGCESGDLPGFLSQDDEQWRSILHYFEKPYHYTTLYDAYRLFRVLEEHDAIERGDIEAGAMPFYKQEPQLHLRVYLPPEFDGDGEDFAYEPRDCSICGDQPDQDQQAAATVNPGPEERYLCPNHLDQFLTAEEDDPEITVAGFVTLKKIQQEVSA